MRTIKVPAGIGDNIWLLQKLVNAGEQFNFQLPDGKPRRGKQIFDLLPSVSASCEYVPKFTYNYIKAHNIQNRLKNWKDIKANDFYLSANEHLEAGRRIENFLPDLPPSYRINWDTEQYHNEAMQVISDCHATGFIGIYGSSYSTSRAWGFWDEHKWLELSQMIYRHNPGYKFVIIGAEWDLDLGRNLAKLLEKGSIPYVSSIGQPLGVVIEIMKKLTYFFSFPSGLGILAPTISCPVTMFYPTHLAPMMNAWAAEEDIILGTYKGCQFCEPKAIFDWVIENKKI